MSWIDKFFSSVNAVVLNGITLISGIVSGTATQLLSSVPVKWQVGNNLGSTLSDSAEAVYSDASQHTLYTYAIPNGTTMLKVSVAGTKTDQTASGGRESYLVVRNNAGAISTDVALVDTIATWGAYTIAISVVSTNVLIQVTGVNAVRWRVEVQAQVYP